ncbi:MAG: DNA methylase [Bacteroidaceae bacterium]|nr:DNA methylase [Bacteroidaceae bacterium]
MLQRLRDNIAAIKYVLTGEGDREVLAKYTGFGGMNFILNPIDRPWNKSEQVYVDDTIELHTLLRSHCSSEREYDAWMQSLKASVLTAYYTPAHFVRHLFNALYGINDTYYGNKFLPKTMLDPAAGMGVFAFSAKLRSLGTRELQVTAYEKDLLTGMMLNTHKGDGLSVFVDGFEKFPKEELGLYDLVATNVPFGDIRVFDPEYSNSKSEVRREAARMIHRYYVLKGLDCLRDGGLEVYIITSNYLNRDGEQLAEALKQSRLIGAYRLANNLFKESGTEVGTDLLVLQKDSGKQGLTADETWLLTQYEDSGCPTNMYFDMKPDHVIATTWTVDTDAYGKRALVYMHRDGVSGISRQMSEVLAKDMKSNFDVKLYEGSPAATVCSTGGDMKVRAKAEKSGKEQLLEGILEEYTALYEREQSTRTEQADKREHLNQLYDYFVQCYGCMNDKKNIKAVEHVSKELLSLEVKEGGGWQKADIFRKPVAFATESVLTAATAQEALAVSLNEYGWVNILRMKELTGKDEDELARELEGEIFYNPLELKFETRSKFISGNVIEKLEKIKECYPKVAQYLVGQTDEHTNLPELEVPEEVRILQSMKALRDAIPTPIPFEDLDFNLGERWMDADIYGKFASEFFSMPEEEGKSSYWSGKVTVTVKYNPLLDQFAASATSHNEKIWSQYSISSEATRSLDGIELLIHALQNTCPKMLKYKRDAQGRCIYNDKGEHETVEDADKTQLANAKIEEIRQGYQDWLLRQPKELKDELTALYNRRFNCFVKPKYDGSHQTFPGIDMKGLERKYGVKSLYDSQRDCIWMLVQNGGGICDHEVGSGKTLIMCIAAHEMKRLGLAHKPMIIGLKANVSAIAETYRTAYPQAKVLYATAADFSGSERADFFNRMKNNNWDCVIMSHDQFSRIPQSDEVQRDMLYDEMRQIDEALEVARQWGYSISARVLKGLERRKQNMAAKIQAIQNAIQTRTDDVVDFAMMGIDHIFVDESHMFKNLGFSTRHDRVAGLGNNEGSKRAYNLLMAIRTIQQRTGRDLGATFLSGTTVTNSLTELYSLFRYLRPKALEKQGITCFDAWAAIFTKKSTEYEFSITNQIILKERFRYFIKVPELAMFYNEITDFRTAEDVGIDRPRKHTMLLNIKPTPYQEQYIKTLMEFARSGDFRLIGMENVTDQQQKAKMLYATDKARKMSLDMRLIDESYPDHPQSKASRCAELIKQYYDLYAEQRGTQMVFSDLSAYDPKKWNVYSEIKRKLVEDYGIPANEIRFIQEAKCESKKNALIKDVNDGKVRVLFGSTQMLGTGVNAQQRVVAVHHLDTPWRPSDLEQRDGRAVRRGNEVAKQYAGNQVDIIIYAVERSLDSYKFNLLHCKQTFIQQLKRGQLSIRTLDEGVMDEKTGANFAEFMAVLSGNTDLLERAKLEKKIAGLEAEKKTFAREKVEQEHRRERLEKDCEVLEQNIRSVREDAERFTNEVRRLPDGGVANDIVIDGFVAYRLDKDGKPYGKPISPLHSVTADDFAKAVGQEMLRIAATARTDGRHVTIGNIYGFPISVKTTTTTTILDGKEQTDYTNQFYVSGDRLMYIVNKTGRLNRTSAALSATLPLQTLQHLSDIANGWQQSLDEDRRRIQQLSDILAQTWPKEEALKQLRADLSILDRKISKSIHIDEQPIQQAA